MPKKKGCKSSINKDKIVNQDFTINDCANAPKPVGKLKKSTVPEGSLADSWDQLQGDDFDIIQHVNQDGTREFVNQKKNHSKYENNNDDQTSTVYPEIVWYLVSQFVKPEDVGRFAGINRATYAITKRESFWLLLYKKHCESSPKLPLRLRLEISYKVYGLRQRVIRALHHTYEVFVNKVLQQAAHDRKPHDLVKQLCVNVWFSKDLRHWSTYFKFKKLNPFQRVDTNRIGFIEELGRVDANPEEDSQVLQITCQNFYEVPPLMGMTLSSVSVVLSQGFRHHRLQMGFNKGYHNVSKNILPEYTVVLDTVLNMRVFDWWDPNYPHFDNQLPLSMRDEEALPVLMEDFFTMQEGDL